MSSYAATRIAERRRAVTLLGNLQRGFEKRRQYSNADALLRAKMDTERDLREEAEQLIEEGVRMSFAHCDYADSFKHLQAADLCTEGAAA